MGPISSFNFYHDGGRDYLQLHALRSPVGHYLQEYQDNPELYDRDVRVAVLRFEAENDVEIFELGRSGRHICIEDTPRNRRRYANLQRKAIAAANKLWATMREVK